MCIPVCVSVCVRETMHLYVCICICVSVFVLCVCMFCVCVCMHVHVCFYVLNIDAYVVFMVHFSCAAAVRHTCHDHACKVVC